MRVITRHFGPIFIFIFLYASLVWGQTNWPEFRGPEGDGRITSESIPLKWSETENVRWKTAIHDIGYSTPVIWGDQVWLTTATKDGTKMYALCLDFNTGKILHDILVFTNTDPQRIHDLNCYATPSPVIEEGRVYVHFGTFGTACYDTRTDKKVWENRDLHCDHMQGPVSSPILYKDLLILHFDGSDVQYIAALNKNTGKLVWKTDRPKELYVEPAPVYRKSYTTPIIIDWKGALQMISVGGQVVQALNPDNGTEIWRVVLGGDSSVPSPVYANGLVYINAGYHARTPSLWAISVDGKGDVTDTHVRWKTDKDISNEASPVIQDGLMYVVNDRGSAACYDAVTGQVYWEHRLAGTYGASLIANKDRVYFFSKKGLCTVFATGKTKKILAENVLDDGFKASPAVKDSVLILRTLSHVYRIENIDK